MVAWQAGTPALWIYHDSRTQELAEIMAVPKISLEDFLANCHTIEEARARVEFQKESYRVRRRHLAQRLLKVLGSEELEVNSQLALL